MAIKLRILLLLALFIISVRPVISSPVFDQEAYQIVVNLKDIGESEIYLAYHLGNRQYLLDTAYVNQQGKAVFQGAEALKPGIYLIVLADERNFELIIDRDHHFTVSADPANFVSTAVFEGSPENEAFYDYLLFIREKSARRNLIHQQLNNPETSPIKDKSCSKKPVSLTCWYNKSKMRSLNHGGKICWHKFSRHKETLNYRIRLYSRTGLLTEKPCTRSTRPGILKI